MKKLICASCLFASVAALAGTVTTPTTTFGALRVDSSEKQTIVAIPWVAASVSGDESIKVTDIIKTANLKNGDRLYSYAGDAFSFWVITNGTWVSGSVVTADKVTASAEAGDAELVRGNAVILVRDYPGECFYVMGQDKAIADLTSTFTAGKNSLIAPPTTTAYNLNSATWAGQDANDRIIFNTANHELIIVKYSGGQWVGRNMTSGSLEWIAANAVIPAGTGAWYQSKGSSNVTVQWASAPAAQ